MFNKELDERRHDQVQASLVTLHFTADYFSFDRKSYQVAPLVIFSPMSIKAGKARKRNEQGMENKIKTNKELLI
jgi:hypothetical protein